MNTTDRFISLSFRSNFLTDALPWVDGGFDLSTFDAVSFNYDGLPTFAPLPGEDVPPPFGASGHLTALTCVSGCDGDAPLAISEPVPFLLLLVGFSAATWSSRGRRKVIAEDDAMMF